LISDDHAAGVDTPATAAAMHAADLSLIPARASTLDLEATRPTLAALARLARAYAFVLNACPPGRSSRIADASPALSLLGVLAPPVVQRMEHVDAIGLGLGVTEMQGSKAGDEPCGHGSGIGWRHGRMKQQPAIA
jgi:chromosome partitioning protein